MQDLLEAIKDYQIFGACDKPLGEDFLVHNYQWSFNKEGQEDRK